jgi:hypothetical protein
LCYLTNKRVDNITIDRRWNSNILDVRFFRGAECDTDHYLVVAKVRETVAVCKQATQIFDVERYNLRKLGELEISKQVRLRSQTEL